MLAHIKSPSNDLILTTPPDRVWVSFENLLLCPKPGRRPFVWPLTWKQWCRLSTPDWADLLPVINPQRFLQKRRMTHTKSPSALPNLLSNKSQHLSQHNSNFNSINQNQTVKLLCCWKPFIIVWPWDSSALPHCVGWFLLFSPFVRPKNWSSENWLKESWWWFSLYWLYCVRYGVKRSEIQI